MKHPPDWTADRTALLPVWRWPRRRAGIRWLDRRQLGGDPFAPWEGESVVTPRAGRRCDQATGSSSVVTAAPVSAAWSLIRRRWRSPTPAAFMCSTTMGRETTGSTSGSRPRCRSAPPRTGTIERQEVAQLCRQGERREVANFCNITTSRGPYWTDFQPRGGGRRMGDSGSWSPG